MPDELCLWLNEEQKENVYSFGSWDVIKCVLISMNNLHTGWERFLCM